MPAGEDPGGGTWEGQYQEYLTLTKRLGSGALAEIQRCTDLAFQSLNPTALPGTRSVGAIVGAVQSGKTGLMINLAARALDTGFRVVIVLAGLKDDLRTQTALRFTTDLLQRGDPMGSIAGASTDERGLGYHGSRSDCWSPRFNEDAHADEAFVHQFCSNLRRGNGVLTVAKKNVAALNRVREALEYASAEFGASSLPTLVLDDECDEASVSGDPDAPTPERIAKLWTDIPQAVGYIGFTATPAANLLQETLSVLYPRDFVLTLRYPADQESATTYIERFVTKRYSGGRVFYEELEAHQRRNCLVRATMSDAEFGGVAGVDDELEEALIAYFVSGAMRLCAQPGSSCRDATRLPAPHTMLVHTESRVDSHWDLCERVILVTRRKGHGQLNVGRNLRRLPPQARLSAGDLERWLELEPARWRAWYDNYVGAREELMNVWPDRHAPPMPAWDATRAALPEVFDAVKLKVVNSDERAVDAPLQFQRAYSQDGIRAPDDVYSIIIGGNRLSRGLTIEGLCTSYYTRNANQLIEDTTVQRERWFGYRGEYLEFCRLFTHRSLAIRLQRFHEHDEDLRRQLAWNIAHGRAPSDATYRFLTIRDSLPTAKLGRGGGPHEIDVSGARLFVDRVQMGGTHEELAAARANEWHALAIAERLGRVGETVLSSRGDALGYAVRAQSVAVACGIMDGFQYTFHNPDPTRGVPWNLREFYRSPNGMTPVTLPTFAPRSDPFLVAAYLKFWKDAYLRCLADPSANTFRAEDSVSDWVPCPAPEFNVVVRFGSLKPKVGSPFAIDLLNRAVSVDGIVGSRWGGHAYGSPGDEWIDVPPEAGDRDAPRSQGTPGLLLLHIIGRDARGVDGAGSAYSCDRPCLGIVVPAGGPCIRYVLADDNQP